MSDPANSPEPEFIPPDDEAVVAGGDRSAQNQWILQTFLIGCGCVGLPFVLIVFGALGVGNTLLRLYRSTGSYQVYQLASETVETDPEVMAALGEPVEAGWASRTQETYETSESGQVCMRFSVAGGDRSGSAYVEANNRAGAWQLHQLVVSVNGETELVVVIPLDAEAQPLCPDFEAPDSFDAPQDEEEEILPEAGTEI